MKNKLLAMIVLGLVSIAILSSCDFNHTHSFGEWQIAKEATCGEDGALYRECECGEKETETIQKTEDHIAGDWFTYKEASCEEEGEMHKDCIGCGMTMETDTIEKLKHIESDWIVVKEATCKEKGLQHKECTECGCTIKEAEISTISLHTEIGL